MKGGVRMNERLEWNRIIEKYPDSWVALTDAQMDGPIIITAIVAAVCKNNRERLEREKQLDSQNAVYMWRKTTESEGAYVL